MSVAIGIDLGTSNSAIAIQRIQAEVLLNCEHESITPSCVTLQNIENEIRPIVGKTARDLRKQFPQETITSVKRLMGRNVQEKEVREIIENKRTSYVITTDPNAPDLASILAHGKLYAPETISSFILRKLVNDGQKYLGEEISQAVVTVPAYFTDRQKFATRKACEMAGLKLLRLLPEPTAAAVSFGIHEMHREENRTIMVFDLGGGTFDLSILSVADGQFMEVTKGGDMWLGGDDVDKILRDIVLQKAEASNPKLAILGCINALSAKDLALFQAEMLEACEKAKIELSAAHEAQIELFGILRDSQNRLVDIDITIQRTEFETALQPTCQRLLAITNEVLEGVCFDAELLDTVLMVGGSSLIPCVQQTLKNRFGDAKVQVHPRPLHAVVEGAAIMARTLAAGDNAAGDNTVGDNTQVNLMHSCAHSYFLQLANGKRHQLVERNAPLPLRVQETLTFTQTDQILARLRILNSIDSIFEPIGELWVYKDEVGGIEHLDHQEKRENISFVLDFEVDEDNIITMRSHVGSPKTQIVRGGMAVSLFQNLEATLARIASVLVSQGQLSEVVRFSRLIVDKIVNTSEDSRLHILKNIDTLDAMADKALDYPRRQLREFKLLLSYAGALFSPCDLKRAEENLAKLEAAYRDLTNADLIEELIDSLDFSKDETLSIATNAVLLSESIRECSKRDSERILGYLRGFAEASRSGQSAVANANLTYIHNVMNDYENNPYNDKAQFHRDVNVAQK